MTPRSGNAAGPDEIPAEAIKADIEIAVNMLYSLFSKIWEKKGVPAQWKEGIIIKLPKKGDLRDYSNCRGIMLLSTPGKVLNRVLLERMKEAEESCSQTKRLPYWSPWNSEESSKFSLRRRRPGDKLVIRSTTTNQISAEKTEPQPFGLGLRRAQKEPSGET